MPETSGRMELWRRLALLLGILIGLALFFYVVPAVISVTAIDWDQEQADELKSYSGYVTQEEKQLNALPLDEYIREKTGGQVLAVDSGQWGTFFTQVSLASSGEYGLSEYGDRVSDDDQDEYWSPILPAAVYFKRDEIPYTQWGLHPQDGDSIYVSANLSGETIYLQLRYHDFQTSVGAMSNPYRIPPGWMYHPFRTYGIIIMALGLLLYIFLPRRRKQPEDIAYSSSSMLAGDLVAVILLLPFYGLPYLINGGTVQAITGIWPVTVIMWCLALFTIILLYYNAWYASYRIELMSEAMYIINCISVTECRYTDMAGVNLVSLSNPGWFRKLFLAVAALSMLSGSRSIQPMGSALLAGTASYGGIEIISRNSSKPVYIWVTNQVGGVLVQNIDRVLEAIKGAGVSINQEMREIEGFAMFM